MDTATRTYLRKEIDRQTRRGVRARAVFAMGAKTRLTQGQTKIPGLLIDAQVFWSAIEKHASRNGWGDSDGSIYQEVARRTGYDAKRIHDISKQKKVSFDVADFIITHVHVCLWLRDPGLSRIYDSINLKLYERMKVPASERERLRMEESSKEKAEERRRLREDSANARTCVVCERTFSPRSHNAKTCSQQCSHLLSLKRKRQRRNPC